MIRLHLTPLLWILSVSAFAQLNLKAGYCLAKVNAPTHDAIVAAHNTAYENIYTEAFAPLDVLHGLDLGLEYRWDVFALEAGWRIKRNRQDARGMLAPREIIRNKLSTSLAAFYTGLVQYYGPVRISASIDYTYLRMKMDFEDPATLTVLNGHGWGSQFSAGIVLGGKGSVSLAITPFVQVHWTDFDISDLKHTLSEGHSMPTHEGYFNYGVTLMFLNGPR